jgi:chemotaxis protein MotB
MKMSARSPMAPVIIKRKKVIAGGGHHGGAWKVAYADFVTAMMAFFMLMWLLNATTEKQRKGIADYFNPSIPINRISGGGDGAFGGESLFSEEQMAQVGTGASAAKPSEERQARGQTGTDSKSKDAETAEFEEIVKSIDEALMGIGGESMVSEQLARHIVTRVTDEGLIVEFFDLENERLFERDSGTSTPIMVEIVQMIARVFSLVRNDVAINGHTQSYPDMLKKNPVWDLSSARAQEVRKLFTDTNFDPKRIERVSGFADRKLVATNPMAVRNNRIELILLRSNRPKN